MITSIDKPPAAVATEQPRFRWAMSELTAAQKPSKGAPAYSRFVNRKLGRVLAAVAYRQGWTPNQVTAVSALFSFAGIVVLAVVTPAWSTGLVVAACLAIGYALDAADGQLARLRGGGSRAGEWLDHMVDATKISSLHVAVAICMFRFTSLPPAWLLVPLGFTVVAAVMFFGMTLNDQLRRNVSAVTGPLPDGGRTSPLRSLLVIPTDYGLLCLVFVVLGAPSVFFATYAALFAANAGFMVLAARKWYRDMALLDRLVIASDAGRVGAS